MTFRMTSVVSRDVDYSSDFRGMRGDDCIQDLPVPCLRLGRGYAALEVVCTGSRILPWCLLSVQQRPLWTLIESCV